MAELTYREAVARGIAQEMARDEDVVFLGEDIAKAGGVFKATVGLLEQFGPLRVRDTPISEQAILGAAMGAAMTGLKPIAEIMFADFLAVCYDYIANEFPKSRYMTNGQVKCPLVVRVGSGGGARFGAQHSQSVENWCMQFPGLKVVAPSSPVDVIGLLAASVRDPDPVIFFEHKSLYATKGEVPDGEIVDQLGRAKVLRAGSDCTLLALGADGTARAGAAERLAAEHGISCEVIDVRSLVPLDAQTMLGSVAKTQPGIHGRGESARAAAGARRSSRSSPTRRSTIWTARRCASPPRIFRCRPPTCWRIWPSPVSRASPRRCSARCPASAVAQEAPLNANANTVSLNVPATGNSSASGQLPAGVPTDLWIGGRWRAASDGSALRCARSRHRAAPRLGRQRHRGGLHCRGGRRAGRVRSLGREDAARARRDSAGAPSS